MALTPLFLLRSMVGRAFRVQFGLPDVAALIPACFRVAEARWRGVEVENCAVGRNEMGEGLAKAGAKNRGMLVVDGGARNGRQRDAILIYLESESWFSGGSAK